MAKSTETPAIPSCEKPIAPDPIARSIVAIVEACSRFRWTVLALAILVTIASGYYTATHFAITTNTNNFISEKLPWRQNLIALDKAFPQRLDQIVVVIDGATPELAEAAAQSLTDRLKRRPDLYQSVVRPDGGSYFNQSALLFQPAADLQRTLKGLSEAKPFLITLAYDPSLRGIVKAVSLIIQGVKTKAVTLDDVDVDRPMALLGDAFDGVLAGRPVFFSWRGLLAEQPADPRELRRFIEIKPVLDYAALMPGEKASDFLRETARDLGISPKSGVTVRLTGLVPMADEEFGNIADGAGLNAAGTGLTVLLIIWLALKSGRIVVAVALSVIAGLAATAAVGLMMVGAFNLISVAFAVLFVGIGTDFGIQFSVRYRAERFKEARLDKALAQAAARAGAPLTLAAAATAAGFFSFLPTDYRGVSELGLIAGVGMAIAFFTSITLLPALLKLFNPPSESEPLGYAALAPVDSFLEKHRVPVIALTLLVAIAGLPLLIYLRFDFNPINLRSPHVESIATYLDLRRDPNMSSHTAEVLVPSVAAAATVAQQLSALPDVGRTMTIDSLVPPDQEPKLAPVP